MSPVFLTRLFLIFAFLIILNLVVCNKELVADSKIKLKHAPLVPSYTNKSVIERHQEHGTETKLLNFIFFSAGQILVQLLVNFLSRSIVSSFGLTANSFSNHNVTTKSPDLQESKFKRYPLPPNHTTNYLYTYNIEYANGSNKLFNSTLYPNYKAYNKLSKIFRKFGNIIKISFTGQIIEKPNNHTLSQQGMPNKSYERPLNRTGSNDFRKTNPVVKLNRNNITQPSFKSDPDSQERLLHGNYASDKGTTHKEIYEKTFHWNATGKNFHDMTREDALKLLRSSPNIQSHHQQGNHGHYTEVNYNVKTSRKPDYSLYRTKNSHRSPIKSPSRSGHPAYGNYSRGLTRQDAQNKPFNKQHTPQNINHNIKENEYNRTAGSKRDPWQNLQNPQNHELVNPPLKNNPHHFIIKNSSQNIINRTRNEHTTQDLNIGTDYHHENPFYDSTINPQQKPSTGNFRYEGNESISRMIGPQNENHPHGIKRSFGHQNIVPFENNFHNLKGKLRSDKPAGQQVAK